MTIETEMPFELLQPWSTFVMKTRLPPLILEKMIRITDEIVENRADNDGDEVGAGQLENQFRIEWEILERENLPEFFIGVCKNFIVQAFCQSKPFEKEHILKEEFFPQITAMWINSQKDNEYFPIHIHTTAKVASIIYLKIPEFLPSRHQYNNPSEDGSTVFVNNCSEDQTWGLGGAAMQVQPQVGDFYIFPASQLHFVYPFRTQDGKGERRSVSFNAEFSSKSEQEFLRKQYEERVDRTLK